jgi:hypothetical protein
VIRQQLTRQTVTRSRVRHHRWLWPLLTVLAIAAFCGLLAWLLGQVYPIGMGSSP